MLIEDGVIVAGADRWRFEQARLAEARVPPTLTGVLQSRLDALPPAERATLQQASVVGRGFWDAAVARLGAGGRGGHGAGEARRGAMRRDPTARGTPDPAGSARPPGSPGPVLKKN